MPGAGLGPMEKGQKTIYEKQRIVGSGHRGMWPRCEEAGGPWSLPYSAESEYIPGGQGLQTGKQL